MPPPPAYGFNCHFLCHLGGPFADPAPPLHVFLSSDAMARANSLASKGCQILDTFADADGMHRKAELGRNCDQDAAPGRAVELGHDQAR